jgi:vacuolar iron transporter family protein
LRSELRRARREAQLQPYVLQEGLLDALANEGLTREAGYRVVQLLSSAPQALFSTAEEKIYGLGSATFGNPIAEGLLMGVAFIIGALIPLVPFILIPWIRIGLIAALAATALVLFGVGYFVEGRLSDSPTPWSSGLRFLCIALGAGAAGYLIGLAIAPLGAPAL